LLQHGMGINLAYDSARMPPVTTRRHPALQDLSTWKLTVSTNSCP